VKIRCLFPALAAAGLLVLAPALAGGGGTTGSAGVALPRLSSDAVAYITQSPAASATYAIATFERSVYITADGGQTWRQIAERGRTL